MSQVRGGALTALALLMAVGCGSQAAPGLAGDREGIEPTDDVPVSAEDTPTSRSNDPPTSVGGEATKGVFVSSSKGLDDAEGSRTRPVRTIAEGIRLGAERRVPVIVCAENYAESIVLRDEVGVFGYFDCSNLESWRRLPAQAKVTAPTSPAVLAEGIEHSVRFEGFEVTAPDMVGVATQDEVALSSYGMIVRNSNDVSLTDISLLAGRGQDGADGVEPAQGNAALSGRANGGDALRQKECTRPLPGHVAIDQELCVPSPFSSPPYRRPGSSGGTSTCKVGSPGGPGGAGGSGPIATKSGLRSGFSTNDARGTPFQATATTAAGGSVPQTYGDKPGDDGLIGAAGTLGTNGIWLFRGEEFVPGDGTAGGVGGPGQGGGGGSGTLHVWTTTINPLGPVSWAPRKTGTFLDVTELGAAGAGGGAGGCGGLPGTGGRGGGASVGLLIVNTKSVKISASREGASSIRSAKGGRAGRGATGTAGTPGGEGGASSGISGARGGKGGEGGHAGLSGHGAPGPSIAIAFQGKRPTIDERVEFVAGEGGDGYEAISEGDQTLPAAEGVAKTEHAF